MNVHVERGVDGDDDADDDGVNDAYADSLLMATPHGDGNNKNGVWSDTYDLYDENGQLDVPGLPLPE